MEKWSGGKMSYQTDLRNKNRGYMKLIVWQRALDLFDMTWRITHVEAQIDFKLRSQLVDAGQSVSANIAEGYGRRSLNEYVQFLYIALGSLAETLTRAIGLQRTEQMSDARFCEFDQLHYEVENRLLRLIEKLEQKKDDGNWMARIAEDPEEYSAEPSLQHSNTPALHS
jgi:four helix bundle protein